MAKRFSELGIKQQDDRKIFNCPQVSVTDILNSEIEVIDYLPDVKTKHGEVATSYIIGRPTARRKANSSRTPQP